MHRTYYALILSLWLLTGWVTIIFAQTTTSPVTITAVDQTHFPTITVEYQLDTTIDASTQPDSLIIMEDGQPVTIDTITTIESRPPRSLLIVIDQGYLSLSRYRQDYNEAELQEILSTLSNGYLQEGDRVGILTGRWDEGTNGRLTIEPHLEQTSDLSQFLPAVQTLDFPLTEITENPVNLNSAQYIDTPDLLETAINDMAGETNGVILFFSALIHAPDEPANNRALGAAERLSAAAQEANIRLVVFQTAGGLSKDEIRLPMQTLAHSEGDYLELKRDRENLPFATAIYDRLWETTTTYSATYRSSTSDASAERTVTIAHVAFPEQAALGHYTVVPEKPQLTNVSVDHIDENQFQFNATVSWPDQMPRQITTLQIGGQTVSTFTFDQNQVSATFSSDMAGAIPIAITDELGFNSDSSITIPALETPPIPLPTPKPDESSVPASGQFIWQITPLNILSWVALLAACGYILIFRRQQMPHVAQRLQHSAQQTMRRLTTIVTGNVRQNPIAFLDIVVARDELIGEKVDLISDITTLGRDPELSDIQLYTMNERSSISGQHCTIQYDNGVFQITDNGSSNGTTVNDTLLEADDPHPLNDGDEIQLGHKARRGALVRFTIAEPIKRKQRVTVAESLFPGSAGVGRVTQTSLTDNITNPPIPDQLPVISDEDNWWKKLE